LNELPLVGVEVMQKNIIGNLESPRQFPGDIDNEERKERGILMP
jgi:hypothetical protein